MTTRVEDETQAYPVDGHGCPALPRPWDPAFPTWVGILDLLTAVLAGLWVPLRLEQPAVTDLAGFRADLAFLALAGPCAWQSFRSLVRWRRAGTPSRFPVGLVVRALLDLAVALPVVSLTSAAGAEQAYLWCIKLLAIRHIAKFQEVAQRLGLHHPALGRLLSLAVVVPLLLHWTATGWIMLGADAEITDPGLRYIRAVYWSITTMASVGYGDITPRTPAQIIYACAVMIVGVGFFGFVLGNVASFLARIDAARMHHEGMRDRLETFMRYHHVPSPLRRRVRDYHRYLWQSRRGYDGGAALGELPSSLRADLLLCVNRDVVHSSPLLRNARPELVRDLILDLRPRVALPGEVLFRQGAPADGMFFILSGAIEILNAEGTVVSRMEGGNLFGEMALVTGTPRTATARAADYCFLFVLDRAAFEGAVLRHPDFGARVAELARQRGAV